jgi:hypothetical protein
MDNVRINKIQKWDFCQVWLKSHDLLVTLTLLWLRQIQSPYCMNCVALKWLSQTTCISPVPAPDWNTLFQSVKTKPPLKWCSSVTNYCLAVLKSILMGAIMLNYVMADFFHIFSNSLYINLPSIQSYIVWTTDSFIKWTTNKMLKGSTLPVS